MNEQHQLTEWGKILETALESAGTENHQEEAVFLAIELLRLELISPDTMFLGYAGAPVNGSGKYAIGGEGSNESNSRSRKRQSIYHDVVPSRLFWQNLSQLKNV